MKRFLIPLVLCAFLLAAPAPAVSALTPQQQISALKHDRNRYLRERNTARHQRDRANKALRAANILVGNLNTEVSKLTTDNTNLRAGLPNAIRAVPLDDFPRLVFQPAREAWPCDSYYTSGSYWSYTFERPYQYC